MKKGHNYCFPKECNMYVALCTGRPRGIWSNQKAKQLPHLYGWPSYHQTYWLLVLGKRMKE